MRAFALAPLLLLFQQTNGCDQPQSSKPAPSPVLPPTHRFEHITEPTTPGMALDTVTGQFCRTWNWEYTNKPNDLSFSTLPTCLSLYESAPANDPLGIRPAAK